MKGSLQIFIFVLSVSAVGQESCIVFIEDFETVSVQEIFENWDNSGNSGGMSLSVDVPENRKGQTSLMMTYTPGKITEAICTKCFRKVMIRFLPVFM